MSMNRFKSVLLMKLFEFFLLIHIYLSRRVVKNNRGAFKNTLLLYGCSYLFWHRRWNECYAYPEVVVDMKFVGQGMMILMYTEHHSMESIRELQTTHSCKWPLNAEIQYDTNEMTQTSSRNSVLNKRGNKFSNFATLTRLASTRKNGTAPRIATATPKSAAATAR